MAAILMRGVIRKTPRIVCRPDLRSNISHFPATMDKIADVDIDDRGRFKYILIKVVEKSTGNSKMIVRGYARYTYHADIFDAVEPAIKEQGCTADCLGGGRLSHEPDKKVIKVWGYSTGFGKADHSVSVEILKKKYTTYEVSWTDEPN